MSRYIDAHFAQLIADEELDSSGKGTVYWVLAHTPTADVVEVVRCKDCIHRDPEDKKCDCSFQAKGGMFPMDDNDFCSYGERRKECKECPEN